MELTVLTGVQVPSYPNPTDILVIGDGDGEVVGEVLRHDTVYEVGLCDIEEVRTRAFLSERDSGADPVPGGHPRIQDVFSPYFPPLLRLCVTVFVGDGFKFLADSTPTYNVITDSSDTVGPPRLPSQKL